MKKTFLSWCAACMLCVLGVMTSCSNDDNVSEIPGSDQDQSGVVAELEGNWIVDLDGRSEIDYGFMTLHFDKAGSGEMGITVYDYDTNGYDQQAVKVTTRMLDDTTVDGMPIKRVELKPDSLSMVAMGITGSEAAEKDTLSIWFDNNVAKIFLDEVSKPDDYDGDGETEDVSNVMQPGVLNTEALNKAKTREYVEMMMYEYGDLEDTDKYAAQAATKRALNTRQGWNWMRDVPDTKKVRDMLIPGTHDAGTCGMGEDWNITLGMTQRKSLREQWDCGIRYFDLRTRYRDSDGGDMIFHSMLDCKMSLGKALDDIIGRLQDHTTEGVVISIKAENNDFGGLGQRTSDIKLIMPVITDGKWGALTVHADISSFLQKAGDIDIYKFDFMPLDAKKTTNEAVKLVEQKLLDKNLLAKFQPDMTMKDLRGKALVMFVNDVKDVDYGKLKDYVVIQEKGELYTPSKSASTTYKEQNDWEVGDKRTYEQYVNEKKESFRKKFEESKDATKKDWVFNAANGYVFECIKIPDYAKVCESCYPSFIDAVRDNPGCHGLVVMDYAGDNTICRVNIYKLVANVFVSGSVVGGIADKVIGFIAGKKKTAIGKSLFKAGYWALSKVTMNDHVHSQDLICALIDGNFTSNAFDPNVITPLAGTNPLKESDPEKFECLFDDKQNTKWCVSMWSKVGPLTDSYWYAEFKSMEPFTAKSYTLITANDIASYNDRNPKRWKLYGKVNAKDQYKLIDERDTEKNGGDGLPTKNYTGKDYTIQHPDKYMYYKLEVYTNWGNKYMMLGGFKFSI